MKQLIPVVISVGGSLISPKEIDIAFLKRFRKIVFEYRHRYRFICVTGGGRWAREGQQALRKLGERRSERWDEIGITATLLNARLLHAAVRDLAHPQIIQKASEVPRRLRSAVTVSSGWTVGQSSDGVAVDLAARVGSAVVINLTNVAGVYPRPPKPGASHPHPIQQLSFAQYFDLVGTNSESGEHVPFGIVGAKKAARRKIKVLIMSGRTPGPLHGYLKTGEVRGSMLF